ncbi:gliding motility-associated C-terminal domain-containing protein [Chitinophaga sp. RAB17]|uniref:T9SS type B sorting domain-containing protein n=1 Tax=Chitinophaga sp. RAB17 TaxID=3233049 RepID=UPI003F9284E2
MKRLLTLCSIVLLFLFPVICCLAEGSKDMYPSGALGNRAYMTSSSTATSALIGNIYNPGRMFVYAKAGEVIYVGSSAQGIGTGTTRLIAPNGNAYNTGASITTGRINNRAEELAGPAALTVGGYTAYNRTVLASEEGIWTIEFDPPNTGSTSLGSGFSPPAANAAWTIANQTAVSTLALIVAWDITVASAGTAQSGRTFLNIFTGNAGTAASAFYGKFNVLTKDGFTYTASSNGIQPFLFAFFVNNKGTRDKATGVPVYKSVDLNSVVSSSGAYSFHNPTLPDDATNITQKLFYNPPSSALPASAPVWVGGAASNTWLISTPVNPVVSQVFFTGREGTPGRSGTPPLGGGYVHFTANQNGNFKILIDVNNNGNTTDPVDRIITGSSVTGDNAILWDGKNGLGVDVANGTTINVTVILFSGEVHFPYMDVENNVNGIVITRTNGSNAPDPTVYWNDQLLGSGTGASVPVDASASPGINSTTNGHKYTNSYGDNSLLDTWAYIFSLPITSSVTVKQYQADLEVINNIPALTAICAGKQISYTTSVRNNGPDSANGAGYSFSFPSQLTNVTVSSVITGNGVIVSGGVTGNAYTAVLNLPNGAVINYTITGTLTDVPVGGNLITKSSVLRPKDVTDPDATSVASGNPTDPDVECNGAPSGTGCNNIKTSSIPVSTAIGSNVINAPQSICIGSTPAALTGNAITGSPVYLWQSSITSATTGFATAAGTTNGKDYTPAISPQTIWFRRIVNSGSCTDTSAAIMITVNPLLQPGVIAGNQTFCSSGDPAAFTQTTPATGGSGIYTYRWQSSLNNTTFNDIAGATLVTYDAPVVSQTTYFRRIVSSTSSGCADMISDTLRVLISATPTSANAGADQNLCNVNATTLSGNTPIAGSGGWRQVSGPATAVIADTTLSNTGISGLSSGTFTFVWTIRNGVCPPSVDTVLITIAPLPSTANAGLDQTLCNVNSTTLGGNIPASGVGTWTQISGAVTATFVNPNLGTTQVQGLQPGSYQFRWAISSGSCATTADTVLVVVNALPTIANAGPDQTKNNSGVFTMGANAATVGTGAWALVSGTASITDPANPNTNITLQPNTNAVLTWSISNGNCPPSVDTVVLNYVKQADLSVIKSDAGNTYTSGGPVSYTITVENFGPSDVNGFSIQDALPAKMINASWTSSVTGVGVSVSPTSGSGATVTATGNMPFAAGNKIVITVTGTVDPASIGGDSLVNQAIVPVPAGTPDPNTGNNSSTVRGAVPNRPPVAVDDQYTTIRDVPVQGNVLTNDSDPENATLTAALVTGPANGILQLNADGTFIYTPNAGFTGTDSYVYRACDDKGACSQATATIQVTAAVLDLKVTKTAAPASAGAGEALTYTITVTNNGPSTLLSTEAFTVTDSLPAGFVAEGYTPSAGSYIPASSQWSGVSLAPGQSVSLTIAGHVAAGFTGNSLSNRVIATPPTGTTDPTPADTTIITPVVHKVEVVVTKTDLTTLYTPGTSVIYNIAYTNHGSSDVLQLNVTDPLPAGITTASWTYAFTAGSQPGGQGTGPIDQKWDLPSGIGVVYTLTLVVPPNFTGPLVNTATAIVPAGYVNVNPAGNSATDTDTAAPRYNVTITKDGPVSEVAGTPITYHLQVVNTGPSDLVGALVNDQLPAAIQNATWTVTGSGTASANVSSGSGNVVFTANLPAGSGNKLDVAITGTVNTAATGSFNNTATVTIPGQPPISSNKIITTVENKTGLNITKESIPAGSVNAGEAIQYKISVTNSGPSDAVGVVIADAIPAAILNPQWQAAGSGGATVTGAVSGSGSNINTTADIPSGTSNVIIVTVTGIVDAAAKDSILNSATASVPGGSTVTGNNEIRVVSKPGLRIVKTGPLAADAGTGIDYTITVTNSGPSDAVNAVITDVVPLNITGVSWTTATTGTATVVNGATGNTNNVLETVNIPAGPNNSVIIHITGTLQTDAGGTITNTAKVQVNNDPPLPSNDIVTTINNNPGLVLSKSGPVTASAGQRIIYTLNISNTGPSDAFNIQLLDTVPGVLLDPQVRVNTYGRTTVASSAITNGILQLTGNFPVGDTNHAVVFLSGIINPTFKGQITNQAFISNGSNPPIASERVVTTVTSDPKVIIIKNAPDTIVAGKLITYRLLVTNTGLSDAQNITISDIIDNTLTGVVWNATPGGSASISSGDNGSGNTVTVGATIPAGAGNYIAITIVGKVAPGATGELSNFATATGADVPTVHSDTVTTRVVNTPSLQISKAGPQNAVGGENVVYTLEITNNGPSNATAVNIADVVPTEVQLTNWTAVASGGAVISGPATGTNNNVAVIANIPADSGKIKITINGTLDPSAAGTIVNTATAAVTGSTPVSASQQTNIRNEPGLNISKTGPATVNAGEQITYTLVARNLGLSDAKEIFIQDVIPSQITGVSWTSAVSGNATITAGNTGTGNNILLTGDLAAGTGNQITVTVTGTVAPDFTGTLNNIAATYQKGRDTVKSETVITTVNNLPALQLVKSAPDTLAAGSAITYTVNITNNGPSDASQITIADVVPANVKNVAWSVTNGGNTTVVGGSGSGNNISFTADIPAGNNNFVLLTITGTIDPAFAGDINNTATATVAGQPVFTSNEAVTHVISSPAVSISKSGPTQSPAGGDISWIITASNNGPSDATGVIIKDTVPAAVTNVSWTTVNNGTGQVTAGGTGSGNVIAVTGNVPAGAGNTIQVLVTGKVSSSYTGAPLVNRVVATIPGMPDKQDTAITTITSTPGLQIVKIGPGAISAGDHVTYTLTITNNGPSDAVNAVIADVVDPALQNPAWTVVTNGPGTSVSSTSGTGDINITGNIPATPANSIVITLTGTLSPDYTAIVLANVASATPPGLPGVSSVVTSTVTRKADLQLVKSGPANAVAGEPVTYNITVTNRGPSNVKLVHIADMIPPGIIDATWTATATGTGAAVSAASGTGNVDLTADIPANTGIISIVINARVNPGAVAGDIANTAIATPPAAVADSTPATATVITNITRAADLVIVKSGPANRAAGQDITWQLVVTNRGISDVANAVITDNVPNFATITDVTTSTQGNATAQTPVIVDKLVTVNADIAAGAGNEVIITIKGKVASEAIGTLTNTATVAPPADVTETIPANNSSTINTALVSDIGLQLSKSGPAAVNIGDTINYNILVINTGLSDANGVAIADIVPAAVSAVTWTAVATGTANVSAPSGTGNNINLTGLLGANQTGSIEINIKGIVGTTSGGTITNTATATFGSIKSSQVVTTVNKTANLRISKTAPSAMAAGQPITYVVKVYNAGPAGVTGADINDVVPAAITNLNWTATTTSGATVSPNNGSATSIHLTTDLPANTDTVTLTINGIVAVDFTGTLTNTATATPPPGVTNPVPATVTVNTVVTSQPGLVLVKSGPAEIIAGSAITYRLELRNNGPSNATGVKLEDVIPAAVLLPSWIATGNGTTNSGTGNVSVSRDIPVDSVLTVIITGTTDPAANGTIANSAVATVNGQTINSNVVNTNIVNKPSLQISKSGPAKIAAGQSISYVLKVTNSGPSTANGITVSDQIPAAIKNATWNATAGGSAAITGGNISNRSGNVVFTANLPAGSANSIVVTITGTVDAASSGTLTNVANVTPVDGQPVTATAISEITGNPGLRLVKSAPDSATAGAAITYTIDAYNDGPSDAVNMVLTDVIPVQLQQAVWSATAAGAATISGGNVTGQTGNVNITGSIPAGSGNVIHIVINGIIDPAFAGSIRNVASATVNGTTTSSNDVVTTVANRTAIRLVKSGPSRAVAGSQITYTMVLTNGGPSDATAITVSDILPAQLQNPVWSATAAGAAAINGGNIVGRTGNVSFVANVPAGIANRVLVSITGTIAPSFIGTVTNVGGYTINNLPEVPTAPVVTNVVAEPGLQLRKSGPDTLAAGRRITYVLEASNTGPSDAGNVTISDAVPAGVQQVSWTAVANGATIIGAATGNNNNVSVNGNIPAGGSIVVTVNGTIATGQTGTILNKASLQLNETVVARDSVNTRIVNTPGVSITKSGPQQVNAGSPVTYNIDLTNAGPSDLVNALVKDIVPAQIKQVTWSISLDGSATLAAGTAVTGIGNTISFHGNVPAGNTNGIHVIVTGIADPDFTGVITNIATATDNLGKAYNASVTTEVKQLAQMAIVKSGPATLNAGDVISYLVTATNLGPSNATGISITDVVSATVTDVTWTAVANGNAVINSATAGTGNNISVLGDIDGGAGNNIQVLINGKVPANTTAESISNQAVLKQPDGSNINSVPVVTTISRRARISIVKQAPPTAIAGDSLRYVINVSNSGPSDATAVAISDIVSDTLSGVSWSATTKGTAQVSGASSGTGNNITLQAVLPAGAGNIVTIQVVGRIAPGFSGILNNQAFTTSNGERTSSGITTTRVTPQSALTITKTGPAAVNAGDTISYDVTVTNAGPSDIAGVTVTDIVPATVTGVSWTAIANGSAAIVGAAAGTGNNISIGANIPAGVGNKILLRIKGSIPANTTATSISNTATLTRPDTTTITTVPVITTIGRKAQIRIVKQAAATANAGDSLKYTISITNDGPSDATGIQIRDIVSDTLSGVSWIATTTGAAQVTGNNTGVGNVAVTGNITAGAGNVINIQISGKINPDFIGSITNTASATDANNKTVTAAATTQVTASSQLSIIKTGDAQVNAGDTVHYVITASNAGPSSAAGVSITDAVPATVGNVTWTAVAGGTSQVINGATGSGNNVLVKGNIGVGSGNTIVVNIMGVVGSGVTTSVSNIAVLKPATGDTIPSTPVITVVTKKPTLRIVKQAAATAIAGDSLKYTITVTNDGPSDATGVKISDIVSDTLSGVSWTANTTGVASIVGSNTGSGDVTLTGNITAGAGNAINIQISGKINPDFIGSITNTASATDANNNTVNGTATTQVSAQSQLSIVKTGSAQVNAGDTVRYVITATNAGPSSAAGVSITDAVPATVGNVTWTAVPSGTSQVTSGAAGSGNNVLVKGNIGAGNTIIVNITGVVGSGVTTSVSNIAVLKPATGDSIPSTPVITVVTKKPTLRIVKQAAATAIAGDSLKYTITVTNDGPSDATGVKISDVVSDTLSGVSWTASTTGVASIVGSNTGSGDVTLTGNITAGAGNAINIQISGKINPDFIGSITNTASATDANNNTVNGTATTQVSARSQLSIVKTGNAQVNAGDTVRYVITASNAGPSGAAGVSITDAVPATVGSVTWTAVASGTSQVTSGAAGSGNNVLVKGNIGVGNTIIVNITGVVGSGVTTSVSNIAVLKPATGDSIPSTPVITVVTKKPTLRIVKQAAAAAIAGDSLKYTITVTNDGPSDATGVKISDVVSDTLSGVSWTASTTGAASITGNSTGSGDVTLTGNITAGAGNAINIQISGKINPGFIGSITNTASATDANNNTVNGTATTQVSARSQLSITKTGTAQVNAGDTVRYVITASNAGPSGAPGVSITDAVPVAVGNVTWTAVASGTSQVTSGAAGSGNNVVVKGNIDAGNTIVVNIMGVVGSGTSTSISNIAVLKPATGDSIPSTPVITVVTKKPTLRIVKQAAATAIAGDSLKYTITITNDGPSDATGVKISDIVSDTLSGVSWTANTTGAASITGNSTGNGDVTLTGNITAGAGNAINIQISGKINPGFIGSITNTASATDANNHTVNGTATTQVTARSQLSITKTGDAQVKAGDPVHYVIIATNAGPSGAAGISITDAVPAAVGNITWTAVANGTSQIIGAATGSGNNVTVNGNLDAGSNNTIQVNVAGVIPADATVTSVSNTAILKQGTAPPIPTQPVITVVVPAVKTLDLSITKTGPRTIRENDSITYVLVANNAGPAAGDGAVITDILPASIQGAYTVVSATTGGAANIQLSNTGNVIRATAGTFPAGASITITIRGKVLTTAQLRNQAIVAAPAGMTDPNQENNTSVSVVTNVEASPTADLQVKKELQNTTPLQVGGKAAFAITLNNAGPFTATRIVVRDTLNSNLDIINGFDASAGEVTYDPGTKIIVWTLDSLQLTQTATLKYTTRVTNIGAVVNSATASSSLPDPDVSNNRATSQVVTVTGDDILIPNVITPNGDGKNDKLIIIGISRYPNSSLFIYNRWGNQVYQSKNYQNEWDGKDLNEGTYYYILKLNTPEGERSYKGWIELLR